MSLRRRLSVLVAFALLPPLLLTLYNTVRWQLVLEREARAEVLAVARLVSAELAQVVEGARQLMVAMSKHPAVPDREAECTAYFKSVIAGIPLYRQAAVIDPHATFHCSTIPIPANLNVRDRIYFQEPQITGQLAIGTLVQGRVTREPSIHISMPFTDANDRQRGVIVLILNPERLAQNLDARPWRSRYRLTVFDREGNPVLTTPRDDSEEAQAAARDLFSKIASIAVRHGRREGAAGQSRNRRLRAGRHLPREPVRHRRHRPRSGAGGSEIRQCAQSCVSR